MTFRQHLIANRDMYKSLSDDHCREIKGLIYLNLYKEYEHLLRSYDEDYPSKRKQK